MPYVNGKFIDKSQLTAGSSSATGVANAGTAEQTNTGVAGMDTDKLRTALFLYGLQNPKAITKLSGLMNILPKPAKKTASQIAKEEEAQKDREDLIGGLKRLKVLQKAMNPQEKLWASIPLIGEKSGSLVSPLIGRYQASRDLTSQTVARLFEKGRLSDEDRKFYLKLFKPPAAPAFSSSIDELTSRFEKRLKNSSYVETEDPYSNESLENEVDYANNPDWEEVQ